MAAAAGATDGAPGTTFAWQCAKSCDPGVVERAVDAIALTVLTGAGGPEALPSWAVRAYNDASSLPSATGIHLNAATHVLDPVVLYARRTPAQRSCTWIIDTTPEGMRVPAKVCKEGKVHYLNSADCQSILGGIIWLWSAPALGLYKDGGTWRTLGNWWQLIAEALPRVAKAVESLGEAELLRRLQLVLSDCGVTGLLPSVTASSPLASVPTTPYIQTSYAQGGQPDDTSEQLACRALASFKEASAEPLLLAARSAERDANAQQRAALLAATIPPRAGKIGLTLTQAALIHCYCEWAQAERTAGTAPADNFASLRVLDEFRALEFSVHSTTGQLRVAALLALHSVDIGELIGDAVQPLSHKDRVTITAVQSGARARCHPLFVRVVGSALPSTILLQTPDAELARASLAAVFKAHTKFVHELARSGAAALKENAVSKFDISQFANITRELFGPAVAQRIAHTIFQREAAAAQGTTAEPPAEFTVILDYFVSAYYETAASGAARGGIWDARDFLTGIPGVFRVQIAVKRRPADAVTSPHGPYRELAAFLQLRVTVTPEPCMKAHELKPDTVPVALSDLKKLLQDGPHPSAAPDTTTAAHVPVSAGVPPSSARQAATGIGSAADASSAPASSRTTPPAEDVSERAAAQQQDSLPGGGAAAQPAARPRESSELLVATLAALARPDAITGWGDPTLEAFRLGCGLEPGAPVQQLVTNVHALLEASGTGCVSQAPLIFPLLSLIMIERPSFRATLATVLKVVQICLRGDRLYLQGAPTASANETQAFVRRIFQSDLLRAQPSPGAADGTPSPHHAGFAFSVVHPGACNGGACTCGDDKIRIVANYRLDWSADTPDSVDRPTASASTIANLHYLAIQVHRHLASRLAGFNKFGTDSPFKTADDLGAKRTGDGSSSFDHVTAPMDCSQGMQPGLAAVGRFAVLMAVTELCAYSGLQTQEAYARIRALFEAYVNDLRAALERTFDEALNAEVGREPPVPSRRVTRGAAAAERNGQAARRRQEDEDIERLTRLLRCIIEAFERADAPRPAPGTAQPEDPLQGLLRSMDSAMKFARCLLESKTDAGSEAAEAEAATATSRAHVYHMLLWVHGVYEPLHHHRMASKFPEVVNKLTQVAEACAPEHQISVFQSGGDKIPITCGALRDTILPHASSFIAWQLGGGAPPLPPGAPVRDCKTQTMLFLSEQLPDGVEVPAAQRGKVLQVGRQVVQPPYRLLETTSTHTATTVETALNNHAALPRMVRAGLRTIGQVVTAISKAADGLTLANASTTKVDTAKRARKASNRVTNALVQCVIDGRTTSKATFSRSEVVRVPTWQRFKEATHEAAVAMRRCLGCDDPARADAAGDDTAPKKINRAHLESVRPRAFLVSMLSRALPAALSAALQRFTDSRRSASSSAAPASSSAAPASSSARRASASAAPASASARRARSSAAPASLLEALLADLKAIATSLPGATLPPQARADLPAVEITPATSGDLADRAVAWGDHLARAQLKVPHLPIALPGRPLSDTAKRTEAQRREHEAARMQKRADDMAAIRAAWEVDKTTLSFGGQHGLSRMIRDGLAAQGQAEAEGGGTTGWYPDCMRRNPATPAQLLDFARVFNLKYILQLRKHDCAPALRLLLHPAHFDALFYTPKRAVEQRKDTWKANGCTIGLLEYLRQLAHKELSHVGLDPGVATLIAAARPNGDAVYDASTKVLIDVRKNPSTFDSMLAADPNAREAAVAYRDVPSVSEVGSPAPKVARVHKRCDASGDTPRRPPAPPKSLSETWGIVRGLAPADAPQTPTASNVAAGAVSAPETPAALASTVAAGAASAPETPSALASTIAAGVASAPAAAVPPPAPTSIPAASRKQPASPPARSDNVGAAHAVEGRAARRTRRSATPAPQATDATVDARPGASAQPVAAQGRKRARREPAAAERVAGATALRAEAPASATAAASSASEHTIAVEPASSQTVASSRAPEREQRRRGHSLGSTASGAAAAGRKRRFHPPQHASAVAAAAVQKRPRGAAAAVASAVASRRPGPPPTGSAAAAASAASSTPGPRSPPRHGPVQSSSQLPRTTMARTITRRPAKRPAGDMWQRKHRPQGQRWPRLGRPRAVPRRAARAGTEASRTGTSAAGAAASHASSSRGATATAARAPRSVLTQAILHARPRYVQTRYRKVLLRKVAKEVLKAAAAEQRDGSTTGPSARRTRVVVIHVGGADFSSSYRGLPPFAARGFRKVLAVVAIACRGMGGVARFLTVHTVEFNSSKHCRCCGQRLVKPVRPGVKKLETLLKEEYPAWSSERVQIAARTLANKEVRAVKYCPTCAVYVHRDGQAAANIAKPGVILQELAQHDMLPPVSTYMPHGRAAPMRHREMCIPVPLGSTAEGKATMAAAKAAVAWRRPVGLRTPSGKPAEGVLEWGKMTPEELQRVDRAVKRHEKKRARLARSGTAARL